MQHKENFLFLMKFTSSHLQQGTEQGTELTTLPRYNLATYFYCTAHNFKMRFSANTVMPNTAIMGSHTASLEFCMLLQLVQCTQPPALHKHFRPSWTLAPSEVCHDSSASASWLFESVSEIS